MTTWVSASPSSPVVNERRAYPRVLGLWSGIGLVIANMIGAGVFLSAGFMAQDLRPGQIMLAWVVGAVIALAGARAYAEIVRIVPRSGGEYRFLSDLLHPALGYFAGWASLLLGFSAPIAIDGLAAGAFLATIVPGVSVVAVATILIVALTAAHAAGLEWSKWTQNTLIAFKLLLVVGFVVVGLTLGSTEPPTWEPTNQTTGFPLSAFMTGLFFIAFAFSGWNAAVYVASEFRAPRRDVPRAMLIGCATVAILYLLVNWVLVANVTPEQAKAVFEYESSRVTLGHIVIRTLLGPGGASAMSAIAFVAFVSAMSAMILAGPRVYAAMADDGLLPRILGTRRGRPPVGSVLLQGAVALLIVWTHTLRSVLQNIGAVLTLFAALTCLSLFVVFFRRRARPSRIALAAAAVYLLSSMWMLYFGFRQSSQLIWWVAGSAVIAFGAYYATSRFRPARTEIRSPASSYSPTEESAIVGKSAAYSASDRNEK
jgi:APA family basic amino acid/polyamine antiporter